MPDSHHSENTRRIIAYLSYLRDISRKIISRSGFEKCLLNKSLGYAFQFENLPVRLLRFEDYYDDVSRYVTFLQKNHDKRLFLGFGMVAGLKKRTFAAPLLTLQCEVTKQENTQIILIEPDLGTLGLNYDLVAALSTNFFNEEDDVLNPLTEDENRTIEQIEAQTKEIDEFDVIAINRLACDAFNQLKKNVNHFKEIEVVDSGDYDFKNELSKYTLRQPNSRAKGNGRSKQAKRERSMFEKELTFAPANHAFVNLVPDQLSTYEALNTFLQTIEEVGDFNNPVVEKLLVNALTDERTEVGREPIEDDLQKLIDVYVPLSLSNSQIQALKNAWANEISYIQGPPGTGKSHTISALVLSAIALDKKVLVVSQKRAALSVVNKKIEPLLTDGDGLIGVCYYDKTARKKIKEYCNYLLTQTSNTAQLRRTITTLKDRVNHLQMDLRDKLAALSTERQKLERILSEQRNHKEIHEKFLIELDRLNSDFKQIPKGFQFKTIREEAKYSEALARVERLSNLTAATLSSKLFLHKFKQHLRNKFAVPEDWIRDSTILPYFSRAFINLNKIFTETKEAARRLNADGNSLRKGIKNLKADISNIQKQLIKLKFKLNVFRNIEDRDYQVEIDKLSRMLYYTNSRHIARAMKEIDFPKITDVIPFWTAEIRNLGHLFPLKPDQFDLVVVDEASQVNLAEILPAFYRGAKICIVGDHHQLSLKASGLNFSLSKNFDELTWEKYNREFMRYQTASTRKLTVTQASILDFIKSEEYQTTIREVLLDEHFRSLPNLARYTSKQFYKDPDNPDGRLKVMTETPDKMAIGCFRAVRVDGKRLRNANGETINKGIDAEADEVVKIIEGLTAMHPTLAFQNEYKVPDHIDKNEFTIGVISMIRDQCEKITEFIEERLPESVWSKFDLMIGTPEEFQGNERDIMIFTLCLDSECKSGQGHYQDAKRLNVATSRAKSFTYFVYSPFPKTFDKIYDYLKHINGRVTDEDLIDELVVIEPALPPLNYDKFESDFERYVHAYLDRFVKENSTRSRLTLHNQVKSCGQKRLDFVMFNHDTKKSVAIEVDGSHHFVSNGLKENYTVEHVERMDILTRAGWNIINTPYHKWYRDGWLREDNDPRLGAEISRIYSEIAAYIF